MIAVEKFRTGRVRHLKPGEFFLPFKKGEGKFLGGRVVGREWAINLAEDTKWELAPTEEWQRHHGLIFSDLRFEVDLTSASENEEVGSLLRFEDGYAIVGATRHTRIALCLQGESPSDPFGAIFFSRWQIVTGPDDDPFVLYSRS